MNVGERVFSLMHAEDMVIVAPASPNQIDVYQMLYGLSSYLPFWVVRSVETSQHYVANEIDLVPLSFLEKGDMR